MSSYCSVYGEILQDKKGKFYTTGAKRTGCMFCMFGVHTEKSPNKFELMRETHPKGNTFGTVKCSSGGACKSLKNVPEKIDAIHKRLDKVMIENRDFEKLIKQYDFENAFFYCDPPYSKGCGYEVTSTEDFDHERLREILGNIKGRFLLSYDDSPKIRELYKGFEMIAIERQNGINNRQGDNRLNKVFKELLIANYPIREIHERQTD